ncbi:ubiquitin-like protein ATG12 isoform X3 [Rattus norvegicus]|uniref:ubiquitin-like protein ATG12 isoform X3 n=1 Tax=Rattus norvegicus TaxID=10116 RepID=UPI0008102C17|nr:ubiquitin-like protein ATG12 isoform X2 [Rattus rattus]|eukprot:XP_017456486.1 PREDICTED: ubiquitin-like protein ATG12 isoform X1 [Rattus norvegicus]
MAEDPEAVLQLPAAPAAAAGESLLELSPETAIPEPPSSVAVSPGTEEPPGDTKKKIYLCESVLCPFPRPRSWDSI